MSLATKFGPPRYKTKYPRVPREIMKACIGKIISDEFSTHDFIEVWRQMSKYSSEDFISTGDGWKIAIAKRLSRCVELGLIEKPPSTKDGAQMWRKL